MPNKKTKFLTRDQEKILGRMAKKSDRGAIEVLIVSNLPFIRNIAKKYRAAAVTQADLVQAGVTHMIECIIHAYDPRKPTRLKSIAVWWIRRGMSKAIQEASVISPPSRGFPKGHPLAQSRSIDLAATENDKTMADILAVEDDQEAERREREQVIKEALSQLRPRTRKIVQMRFGFGKYNPHTLSQIGAKLNISAERVRVILIGALESLRVEVRGL